jgi:hypothetical protein
VWLRLGTEGINSARQLVDCNDLGRIYSCRCAEADCEHEDAILHVGIDISRLGTCRPGHQGERQIAELRTDLGMWWDMEPTNKFSKLPLTLHSLSLLWEGFRKWGVGSPCDSYLPCLSIWLSCERHADVAMLNTRQLEHGDHHMRIDVETDIGTN